jgi:hypothetical protein
MRGKTGVARLALETGAPVVPLAMWGVQHIFDPRTKKLSLRPRVPVSVTAGPPVDLSKFAGAAPSRAVLDEMTDEIMLRVRDLLGQLRGETPPPLYERPARRPAGSPPHEPAANPPDESAEVPGSGPDGRLRDESVEGPRGDQERAQ